MPSRRNAVKEVRKDKKRRVRNVYVKATLKTVRKDFDKIIEEGNAEKVCDSYKKLSSTVDKTVKKGVIKAGKADRIKSRCAQKMNAIVQKKS